MAEKGTPGERAGGNPGKAKEFLHSGFAIPRVVHQLWIGPRPRPQTLMDSWKHAHEAEGFEYRMWGNEEVASLEFSFPGLREAVDTIPEINGKADVLRWQILYLHGGVFSDADSLCLRSVAPLLRAYSRSSALLVRENEAVRGPGCAPDMAEDIPTHVPVLATGFMAFGPGHEIPRRALQWIATAPRTLLASRAAWRTVGPGLLTRIHTDLPAAARDTATVLPSYTFLPVHSTGHAYEGHGAIYAHQIWDSTRRAERAGGLGKEEEEARVNSFATLGVPSNSFASLGVPSITEEHEGIPSAEGAKGGERSPSAEGAKGGAARHEKDSVPLSHREKDSAHLSLLRLPACLSPPRGEVSLLVCSHNTPMKHLRPCLDSILHQTGRFRMELVWVDDGSDALHAALLARALAEFGSHRARDMDVRRVVLPTRKGVAAALNAGLALCSCRWVARMDSDDIMTLDRLATQLAFLESSGAAICGGQAAIFRDGEDLPHARTEFPAQLRPTAARRYAPEDFPREIAVHPTLVFARDVLLQAGGYDETFNGAEDFHLLLRFLALRHTLHTLPNVVLYYRLHPAQVTATTSRTHRRTLQDKAIADFLGVAGAPSLRSEFLHS
jgi:hypothetical protein